MPRFLLLALLLAGSPAFGTTFEYGFDGVLADHFTPIFGEGSTFEQANGRLEYSNSLGPDDLADDGEVYAYTGTRPRFDQSWTASVDLIVPAEYDTFQGAIPTNDFEWVDVGFIIGFFTNGDYDFLASHTLDVLLSPERSPQGPVQRFVLSDYVINDGDLDPASNELTTEKVLVQAAFEFDATTKKLTASAEGTNLLTLDLDEEFDWGMQAEDRFDFMLFGESRNEPVSADNPLAIDNFRLVIVPEPAAAVLGVVAFGFARRRPNRA